MNRGEFGRCGVGMDGVGFVNRWPTMTDKNLFSHAKRVNGSAKFPPFFLQDTCTEQTHAYSFVTYWECD